MFLLGVVIEKVTGEDYFGHIRKVIYDPAGMKDSDCYEMDFPVENLAIGYSPDWKSPCGWQNNLYKHVIKGGPAGGGFDGINSKLDIYLDSGYIVAVMSNIDMGANPVARKIGQLLARVSEGS
jgi:CubicO group peptidase (beta-lactamase class C family)